MQLTHRIAPTLVEGYGDVSRACAWSWDLRSAVVLSLLLRCVTPSTTLRRTAAVPFDVRPHDAPDGEAMKDATQTSKAVGTQSTLTAPPQCTHVQYMQVAHIAHVDSNSAGWGREMCALSFHR